MEAIISLSGSTGNYYATNERGQLFHWAVDSSVKFKTAAREKHDQRIVCSCKGSLFKVRSMVAPALSRVTRLTTECESYTPIEFKLQLRDREGIFGNDDFILPLK